MILTACFFGGCDRGDLRSILETVGWLEPWHESAAYREIVARHAAENAHLPSDCVLLLGDSLTSGFPESLTDERGWINRGISGDGVERLLQRLTPSALDAPCPRVLLMIGINDLIQGGSPEATSDAIWQLASTLDQANKHVWLQSLLPVGGEGSARNRQIAEVNHSLAARSRDANGIDWVDVASDFRDADGALDASATPDGLHLVDEAYARWAAILDRQLQSASAATD